MPHKRMFGSMAVGAFLFASVLSMPEAAADEMNSVPLLVSGILISAGGIGGGVALTVAKGPCGKVKSDGEDQCALPAMLLGPAIGGLFIGLPMIVIGGSTADPEEEEDEDAWLVPEVTPSPGGVGLRWRF